MKNNKVLQRLEISFWKVFILLAKDWKRKLAFPLLGIIGICILFCSVWFGILRHRLLTTTDQDESLPDKSNIEQISVNAQQRKILVVLADNFDNKPPSLEGIWLTVYVPYLERLLWLPVYPIFFDGATSEDRFLSGMFGIDENGQPAKLFIETLQAMELRWDNYVLVDHIALEQLIELSGGVDLGEGVMGGAEAMALFPAAMRNPQSALIGQSILARQICQNASVLFVVKPTSIIMRLTDHLYTDISPKFIDTEWRRLQSVDEFFSCEFPTLPEQLMSQVHP